MTRLDILKKRQEKLKEEILAMLDNFLMGSIGKSPSMSGHNLTTKVNGKTVTLYARKAIVPKALEMSKRYNRLWILIQKLSSVHPEMDDFQLIINFKPPAERYNSL
jgi:hypothetical protein